jgi:hypothetical protein
MLEYQASMRVYTGRLDCLVYVMEQAPPSSPASAFSIADWYDACSQAACAGHLECLRYLRERHAAPWIADAAAVCCLSAAYNAKASCLRYVVASSGVSALVVAREAASRGIDAIDAFKACWMCHRMHACATALKRAWKARKAELRTAAATAIARTWLRHHYAPNGRGCEAAHERFKRRCV